MTLKAIQTDQAPAAIGPYSQAIIAPPWLFVSGQLGINPKTGELAGVTLSAQAKQALENMRNVIQAAGLTLDDVVSVDVFMTNIGAFEEFNGIYETFFTPHRPARAVVQVSGLPKGARLEIKCIACRGDAA